MRNFVVNGDGSHRTSAEADLLSRFGRGRANLSISGAQQIFAVDPLCVNCSKGIASRFSRAAPRFRMPIHATTLGLIRRLLRISARKHVYARVRIGEARAFRT